MCTARAKKGSERPRVAAAIGKWYGDAVVKLAVAAVVFAVGFIPEWSR